jgi:uncharacterized membrane protein YdjX (TVP38/TMEM64 family)
VVNGLDTFFQWLADLLPTMGPGAYLLALGVMVIVALIPFPAEAPAMLNGVVFGPVTGTVVTWTGGKLGAWLSFEIARRWGRPVVGRLLPDRSLDNVGRVLDGAGWWGLILARLTPVIAFTALNWGGGLAGVPRSRFLWTTAIGILPGAILFTASGSGASLLIRRWGTPAAVLATAAFLAIIAWGIVRLRAPRESVP